MGLFYLFKFQKMEEIWKCIPGFDGYQASNLGRIKFITSNRITNGTKTNKGYLNVGIQGKSYQVHRLILFAFKGFPTDNKVCDHIDRNPLNNNIENLRWVTQQENTLNRKVWGKSKFKGVSLHVCKYKKKDGSITIGKTLLRSDIFVNKKRISLGYFKTEEEAFEAYKQAFKKYNGYEWMG
jgi:hypothetical protein